MASVGKLERIAGPTSCSGASSAPTAAHCCATTSLEWQERSRAITIASLPASRASWSSLWRQTLRLEEHDDRNHPVIAAAKYRIEELTARRAAIDETVRSLEMNRPDEALPDGPRCAPLPRRPRRALGQQLQNK